MPEQSTRSSDGFGAPRERQAIVHRSSPVPQIGVIFSTAAHYRMINGLFSRNNARVGGVLQALLESQQAVDVVLAIDVSGSMKGEALAAVFARMHFRVQVEIRGRPGGAGKRRAQGVLGIDQGLTASKPRVFGSIS